MSLPIYPILQDVKDYLNIPDGTKPPKSNTSLTYDTFITKLITNVTERINNFCNQPILQVQVNAASYLSYPLIDGDPFLFGDKGGYFYFPYNTPIIPILVQYSDPQVDATIWNTLTENDDYFQDMHNGKYRIYMKKNWNRRFNYNFVLVVGYPQDLIPNDLIDVATQWTVMKFQESTYGNSWLGLNTISTNQSSNTVTTAIKDMLPEWKSVLNKYKYTQWV